jgi:hypothetical protein
MNEKKMPIQRSLFESENKTTKTKKLDEQYYESFSWAVPLAFSDPLALCRFEEGDTLYNTEKAYLSPWSEALKYIKYGIQVTFPQRAVQKKINEEEDSVFESNWHYPLELDFLEFTNNEFEKKTHIKTTQGTLYTFLWKGDFEVFNLKEHPEKPLSGKVLKSHLEQSSQQFIHEIRATSEFTEAFIIPYDKSSTLLTSKFNSILKNAETSIGSVTVLFDRPANFNGKEFSPTLQIACILVNSNDKSILSKTVKKSVYKPAKSRKTKKDQFRIKTHGILINGRNQQ